MQGGTVMTKQETPPFSAKKTTEKTPPASVENPFKPIDWQTMQILLSTACKIEKLPQKKEEFLKQEELGSEEFGPIALLILLLSRLSQTGKMHLRLSAWAGKKIIEPYPHLPKQDELKKRLEKFYNEGGKKIITKEDDLLKPIVWRDDCLYFSKNFFFEKTITDEIKKRTASNKKNNRQSDILKNCLTIIDGGPGTGKTTLVLALVACLLAKGAEDTGAKNTTSGETAENKTPSIKLLAPTGKATNRLKQSLINSLAAVQKNAKFFADLPLFATTTDFAFFDDRRFLDKLRYFINDMEVATLHRFLSIKPGYVLSDKNKELVKSYDYLIIDEASMISPTLLARLFLSIRRDAKLIMLGDQHQLPGVDSENLIAYLAENFFKNPSETFIDLNALRQNKNYRFSEKSSIAAVANALKNFMSDQVGESNEEKISASIPSVVETFKRENEKRGDFTWHYHFEKETSNEVHRPTHLPIAIAEHLKKSLLGHHVEFRSLLKKTKNQTDRHHKLFEHFFKKMVLTSNRHGPLGQRAIVSFVEREIIKAQNLFDTENPYCEGRVVIFLNNDYDNEIMNGDIGMILKDKAGMAKIHLYLSNRTLPVYAIKPQAMETLYALTIHKSQGSEFDDTYLIFSQERQEAHEENSFSPFLSPSLLYTAITRSKKSTTVYLDMPTLKYLLGAKAHGMTHDFQN